MGKKRLIIKLVLFVTPFLCLLLISFPKISIASNAPDFYNSSIQAQTSDGSGLAPADGRTTLKVKVTMKDYLGNPLSGETVSINCTDNTFLTISPSTRVLDGNGQETFDVTTTYSGTYSINVVNKTQNVTLTNLGRITFYSPLCNSTPPGGAPKLESATALSTTQILLKWTPAGDPVTYHLLAYGTKSGEYIYGSENIGGHDATSYTVGSLTPNKRYYFKIRAGNGCAPGGFSNEISAVTTLATATPKEEIQETFVPTSKPTSSVPSETLFPEPSSSSEKTQSRIQNLIPFPFIIIAFIIGGASLLIISLIFLIKKMS